MITGSGGTFRAFGFTKLLSFLALVCLSGCTFVSELKPTVERPQGVSPLPLTIGVYYSPEFLAYKYVRYRGQTSFVVPLGKASTGYFNDVFPMVFEKTVPVRSLPPLGEDYPDVVAVIEPRIEVFDVNFPWAPLGTYTSDVTYRFTLYSKDGTPFISWKVKGHGEYKHKLSDLGDHSVYIGRATEASMQDVAVRFETGISDVPEIKPWLRQVKVMGDK